MSYRVDLLKGNGIAFTELKHVDVDLFGRRSWSKCGDDFRVNVLLKCHWIVESPHECLELSERRKTEMVCGVDEGVDHGQPRLHLLRVEHVLRDEVGLATQTGRIADQQIAG